MEIITFGIIVITSVTSAIFGAATLLLGAKVKELRAQLTDQEVQHHLEEMEALKAIREAQDRIRSLEETARVPVEQIWEERSAKVEILKSRFSNPSFSKVWLRDVALRSLVSELDPFITEEMSGDGREITLTLKVLSDEQ